MKVPFPLWAAHVKRNMQVAELLQRQRGVAPKEENLSTDINDASGRPSLEAVNELFKGKVSAFNVPDADKIVDGATSADAEKARKIVADIRKRHASETK
jgi:hypothetical protein